MQPRGAETAECRSGEAGRRLGLPGAAAPSSRLAAPSAGNGRIHFGAFSAILLPMLLAVVDQTIVVTALPAIAAAMGGMERASWVVVSYLIAATIAAPIYGTLGDAFGRRRLMLVALLILVVASALCSMATSIEALIAARIFQGFGGGGLMTLSQALVAEIASPQERPRYQGYLAAVAVSFNAFGPVAGGYLTQHLGWQSVFLFNVPIGLAAFWLARRLETGARGRAWRGFDWLGLALFVSFVACLMLACEQARRLTMQAVPVTLAFAGFGIVSLVLLCRHERSASCPLLPPALWGKPAIWRTDFLAACHGAALVSLLTFLPIYLQVVRGLSASQTGLALLPLTLGIGAGSLVTGRLVSLTGRTMIFPSVGLSVVTADFLYLALRLQSLTIDQLPWLLLWHGIFMGTVMGVVLVTVQGAAGPQMLGEAAASAQLSRSIGAAFGTALVASALFVALSDADPATAHVFADMVERGSRILATLPPAQAAVAQGEITDAFRAAFLIMAGFAGSGIIVALSVPLRRI
jgi:EmrB/QacA subfamily drug resistance transporter